MRERRPRAVTADYDRYSVSSSVRQRPGGGWLVTVVILRGAEEFRVFDLGRQVVFKDAAVAEAAGLVYGQRWIARQDVGGSVDGATPTAFRPPRFAS